VHDLLVSLREDWEAHGRPFPLASPGFQTVALYRFGRHAQRLSAVMRIPLLVIYRLAATLCRNVYGIELPLDAEVGRRLWLAHQSGIVIGRQVVIGDDCVIRQNVTIGADERGGKRPPPRLGDRVQVGAGAVIVGGAVIGHDARVGPNAFVMRDVPAGASAFAPPAKVLPPMRAPTKGTD
jgi:serine O-acetyltransferase